MRNKYTFTKDDHCITLYKKVTIRDKKSKNFGLVKQEVTEYIKEVLK